LFNYSESLSRRDLPTQLWLIENSVTRNDVPGALIHYDRAMRASEEARTILIPIMVQASADPAIAAAIATLVRNRPLWWAGFVDGAVAQGALPADSLARILQIVRLRADVTGEHDFLVVGIERLARADRLDAAYAIYRQATGSALPLRNTLRDGGFEVEGGLPPFDWILNDEAGLRAVREPGGNGSGNMVLRLMADDGRFGEFARQRVALEPGRYLLTMEAGDVVGDTAAHPLVTLTCVSEAQTAVASLRLPSAPAQGAAVRAGFSIPAAGCASQWLSVSTGAGIDGQALAPWIDSLAIRRE
jgi:hypothetical protein